MVTFRGSDLGILLDVESLPEVSCRVVIASFSRFCGLWPVGIPRFFFFLSLLYALFENPVGGGLCTAMQRCRFCLSERIIVTRTALMS